MRGLAAVTILGLAGFGVFSGQSATPTNDEQLQAGRVSALVTEYVAAVHERSCPRLMQVSARIHNQAECDNELHEFVEHHAEFTTVSKLVRDGRSQAWLATAKLMADGRARDVVLRITRGSQGWRVQT
jgi:hypothetical protein